MAEENQTKSPTLPPFDFHNRFALASPQGHATSQDHDVSSDNQSGDASFTFDFSDFGTMAREQSGGVGAFLGRPAGSNSNPNGEHEEEETSKSTSEVQSITPVVPAEAAADVQTFTPAEANNSIADTQKSGRPSPETLAPPSKDASFHTQVAPPLDLGLSFLGGSHMTGQSLKDALSPPREAEQFSSPQAFNSSASMYSQPREDDVQSQGDQFRSPIHLENTASFQAYTAVTSQSEPQDLVHNSSSPNDVASAPDSSHQQTAFSSVEADKPNAPGGPSLAQQQIPAVYPGSQMHLSHQTYSWQHQEEKSAPTPALMRPDEGNSDLARTALPSSQPQEQMSSVVQEGQAHPQTASEGHTGQDKDQKQGDVQNLFERRIRADDPPPRPLRDIPDIGKLNDADGGLQPQSSRKQPSPQLASQPPPSHPVQQQQSQQTPSTGPLRPLRTLPEPPTSNSLSLIQPIVEQQSRSMSQDVPQNQLAPPTSSMSTDFDDLFRGSTFDDFDRKSGSATDREAFRSAGPVQTSFPQIAGRLAGNAVLDRDTELGQDTNMSLHTGSTSVHSIRSLSGGMPSANSNNSINFSRPSARRSSPPTSIHELAGLRGLPGRVESLDLESPSAPGISPLPIRDSEREGYQESAALPWQSRVQMLGEGGQERSANQLRDERRADAFFAELSGQNGSAAPDLDRQLGFSRDSPEMLNDLTEDNASDFFANDPEPTDDGDAFFQGGNQDSASSVDQQVGLAGESQAARLAAAYQRNECLQSDAASTASAQNRSTLAGGTGNAYIAQSSSSYRDSLMAGRPSTIAASPSGPLLDHSHLKPGQQAALLSHIKTLELYRLNAKKTNDPDLIYEFAVFMIDASKSMPDSPPGPPQPGSKEELIKEAIGLLKKIAERGQSDAQYFLADCYANGIGTPKGRQDFDRAYPLFVLASKHGHPDAAYRAGTCYEKGWGCRRDSGKALQFYRKAAAQSHPGAMYRLATAELNGELGLKRSAKEGVKWLKRSADNATPEFPHALHELALLHERGIDNVLFLDPEYACELLAQAGELGYAPSAYKLGSNYEYGRMGCPQDAGLSIHMYNIAAQQNHKEACFALTAWYLVGAPGILPQSDTEAYLWAKKAAEQELAKAEYAVGYFTEMGIGTVKDLKEAKAWFTRAAEHGDHRANQRLVNLGAPTVKMPKTVSGSDHGKNGHKAGQHGTIDVTDYASLPNSRRTQPTNAPFPSRIESSGMSPAGGVATTFPSPVTMRDVQSLQRENKYLANVAAHQQAQARAAAAVSRSATPPMGLAAPRSEGSLPLAQGHSMSGPAATNGQVYPSFAQQANNMNVRPSRQQHAAVRLPASASGPLPQSNAKPLPALKSNLFDGPPTLPSIRGSGIQQYLDLGAHRTSVGAGANGVNGSALPMPSAIPALYPSYPAREPNSGPAPAQARNTPPPRGESSSNQPAQIPAQRNGPSSTPTPPPAPFSHIGGPPYQPHLEMLRRSEPQRSPQQQLGTPSPPSPQPSSGPGGVQQQQTSRQPSPASPSSALAGAASPQLPLLQHLHQSQNGQHAHGDNPTSTSSQQQQKQEPPLQAQLQGSVRASPASSREEGDASAAAPGDAVAANTSASLPQQFSTEPQPEEPSQILPALPGQPQSGRPSSMPSSPGLQRSQGSPASPSASQAISSEGGPRTEQPQIMQGNSPGPQQQRGTPPPPGSAGGPGPPLQSQQPDLQQPSPGSQPARPDRRVSLGPAMVQQQQPRPHEHPGVGPQQSPQSLQGSPGAQPSFGTLQQQRPSNPFQQGGPGIQYRPSPFHQQSGPFPSQGQPQQAPSSTGQQRPPPHFGQHQRPMPPGQQRPPPPFGQQQRPYHPGQQRPPPPFGQQQGPYPPGQQRPAAPPGQQQQRPFPPNRFGPQSPPPGQGQGQRPPPMSPPPGWQSRPHAPLTQQQHQLPPRQHDWIPSSANRLGESHPSQHPQLPFSSYQGDTGLMTQGMLGLDSDAHATAQIAQRAKILEQRRLAASSQQGGGGGQGAEGASGSAGGSGDGEGRKKKKSWFK